MQRPTLCTLSAFLREHMGPCKISGPSGGTVLSQKRLALILLVGGWISEVGYGGCQRTDCVLSTRSPEVEILGPNYGP